MMLIIKNLTNISFPNISLKNQNNIYLNIHRFDTFRLGLYFFSMTGRPDRALPKNWNKINGASGCTLQNCKFRDKYDEFIGKEFLSDKEKLDIVKYSIIRVKEYGLAMELYLKIKDDNEDFNELAKKYSIGIEKKTNGVIGPLPLERVNDLIKPKLCKNNLNNLNKPFKFNNEWIICRLDDYKESKLDKNTVMNLKSKILDEEIEREIINCYINELNTLLN